MLSKMSIPTNALINHLKKHLFLLLPLVHQREVIHHRLMSHQPHTSQLSHLSRGIIHYFFQPSNQLPISINSMFLLLYPR